MASIDRTAYPRFKRVVSARELAEAFTPTPDEAVQAAHESDRTLWRHRDFVRARLGVKYAGGGAGGG